MDRRASLVLAHREDTSTWLSPPRVKSRIHHVIRWCPVVWCKPWVIIWVSIAKPRIPVKPPATSSTEKPSGSLPWRQVAERTSTWPRTYPSPSTSSAETPSTPTGHPCHFTFHLGRNLVYAENINFVQLHKIFSNIHKPYFYLLWKAQNTV